MKTPGSVVSAPPGAIHSMEAPETILAPLTTSVKPLELARMVLGSSEESCGGIAMFTVSLAVAGFDPPPDAVN